MAVYVDEAVAPREHRQWTPLGRALAAAGDRWTLLIVLALADGPLRLTDLRHHLPGISTGVLNRQLHKMVTLGLLTRQRYRELPPRVEFELTPRSRDLLPIIRDLARWGMGHMWSDPQSREQVDIGAFIRLLPTLVKGTDLSDGVIEMVVKLPESTEHHVFQIQGSSLSLAVDPSSLVVQASVVGCPPEWIHALGPECAPHRLEITGERKLAEQLFRLLPSLSA
jgi:DNA-binding HxlR family transcriptional regulator